MGRSSSFCSWRRLRFLPKPFSSRADEIPSSSAFRTRPRRRPSRTPPTVPEAGKSAQESSLQHEPFLVGEQLPLHLEQRLVGFQELLRPRADLLREPFPLACLA